MTDLATQAHTLWGLELPPESPALFDAYAALLLEWNQKFNLTSITDPEGVRVKHFLDSLSLLTLPNLPEKPHVIDVGAGAGLPGLALQIARPAWRVTLNDATGKKVNFIQQVIQTLGLGNAAAFQMRAEDAGQHADHREKYDLVLARALARLPILVEYLLPLCRLGGLVVAMKGETAPTELKDANYAIQELGGMFEGLHTIILPNVEIPHYLVCIRKVEATPKAYPRRAGLPTQSPLGASSPQNDSPPRAR